MHTKKLLPILQVGDVLLSSDCLTECFCCDLTACHGACCVEGDAGAPVTLDEVMSIEDALDVVWPRLSAQAQAVIDRQGVAYNDQEGDLVTSIVGGKDCVFTYKDALPGDEPIPVTFCALETAWREGRTTFCKPASCALYPIREKQFSGGLVGLNYHQWDVCAEARRKGQEQNLRVYQFLKNPLINRFGEAWYAELEELVDALRAEGYQL